ncbi:uncharacterized protein LOC127737994 isoform X4 [Mytilus californianus]|uniref:uncharacterized protein LOC127737994 isoform X4 n=1 Tax=Mytilus californianus TaxID=6549 RepID=UPI002247BBE0|nr:uncharacterized protein LOC127737994 isoform X4 [Mytilus californianus]
METPFCKRFAKNHWIAGFIESSSLKHDGPEHYGTMKAKRGKYRLSPNEEAQLVKDETERRRKQRIIQVREQSKQNAEKIRQAVKLERDRQVTKLAVELQNQLEKEKDEKVRKLETQYENSLKSIGQGHKEAVEQYDRTEERELLQKEDNRRAEARGSAAMDKLKRERMFREFEETKQIKARQAALEEERKRAAMIASLPPPDPDPLLDINIPTKKPVKMTDVDNFTTTHYHILEQYSIDKANPVTQEDARAAAEEEERRIRERSQELVRLSNDRMARARVRHNNALEKEILSHDYDKMLMDLSDLQRADRERRLHVVANIPKQVFEPPHRRIEDREDHQRNLETAFEDMYMAQTDYVGDLSLALDPHPPPETPSTTESLEVSIMTDGTPVQEPTLPRIPPVLRDMTNIPRAQGEKSPVKKPEKVLKKLMDKIKSQRDEWISKSNVDLNIPDDTTTKVLEPGRHVPGTETDEVPTKLSAPESTGDISVDSVLEQQKELDPILNLMAYGTNMINQKRVLEEKLKALEGEHAAYKQTAKSRLAHNEGYPPIHTQLMNGHATSREQMSSRYSWSVPQSMHQPPLSTGPITAKPYLTTAGTAQPQIQQHMPVQHTDRIGMTVSEQPYPIPVTLLPREPVVSSLPKQYIPLSHRQQGDMPPLSSVNVSSRIQPPAYTSALSQILTQHEAGSFGVRQPAVQSQQQYIPPSVAPVSVFSHESVHHPSLSMSSLSGSSGEYYPQTFPTPSLPIPSTVGLIPVTSYAAQQDHSKKIKDYQQYLLQRHEQSKKVLADTRAEIEKRRQELLQRFPQLAGQSPETNKGDEQITAADSRANIPPPPEVSQTIAQTTELSPSKTAISSLVTQLASDPYYAQRLGIGKEINSKPELSQTNNKFRDVKKSLPFDESLQESPYTQVHDSGGKFRQTEFDSTMETDDRRDLDDTVMSSSTDRGSPKLPMNGRRSAQSAESDMDTSSQSTGRDQNEIYDNRQQELKKQLEEIQKQKEAILQRHDMAHLRLHAEQERLKYQMAEEEKRLTPDFTSEDSTTEVDTDEERRGDILTTKHLRGPPQKQKLNLLGEHRPHELSTIQEVDTPRSAQRSLESGKPSLSSSGSSVSRRSLDSYHLSTGTIPEEKEPQEQFVTPTYPRTAGETGYQTQQIEQILERAREFDPSVVDRLKQQTNDIFANIATPPQKGGTPGSNMSLSMGSLTPDSLSTGPISDSNVSTQYNSPSDAPAFKVVNQKGRDNSRSDSSYRSGMSWADELSSYSGQYHSMKMDDSSKTSADSRLEPSSRVLNSSSQEKLNHQATDDRRPSKSPVDRKYDVFHMKIEQPNIEKPGSSFNSRNFKHVDESISSDSSSRLNIQELSEITPLERSNKQGELSQYPLLEKSGQMEQSSSDDRSRGYTSSSAVNESSARESPLGGAEDNVEDSKLLRTGESLASTATSASSYMDLDAVSGINRPFDFIGQFKFTAKDHSVPNSSDDLIDLDSSKYTEKGGFTSTPYTTENKMSSQLLSEPSQYDLTPGDIQVRSGAIPQSFGISSNQTPAFVSRSGEFGSDFSDQGSGEKKVGVTLSQYSLKSDTPGVTLIGKELSQYTIGSENVSPLSQYSIETTENISPDQAIKSLSQYSLEPSASQDTKDDSSLSQHSLDPSRQISGFSLSKGDKSMTQYSFSTDLTAETTQSSGHDHVDGHLSQYSLQTNEKSLTHGKLSDSDLMHTSKMPATDNLSLSQHALDSTNDDNDSIVEKKFANLDNLIRESRDLIAKHKKLITKNKEWEEQSTESTPERKNDNQNSNNNNLIEMMGLRLEPEVISTKLETSESSFNVTDDVSPMMITASSADMTQDHFKTVDSLSIDNSVGHKFGDSALSRLSQLDTTAGISDEPDLTLVTESSEVSINQEGQLTHRSECSNNDDSVWSFEQHEQSARSSPDITENDFPDLPQDKGEEEDHSGLAGQTLQESFERRQQSMPSVKRDAGEDVVFRAVPVVVSPTLSFSMKLNSDIKPKAPLTWASELSGEQELPALAAGARPSFKLAEPKHVSKKDSVNKKSEKPVTAVSKSKSSGNLNPALQPRSAGSVPSISTSSGDEKSLGHSKSAGIISLGDFLKRQISNEDDNSAKSESFSQKNNSALVTTKNKPGPSINTKPASVSKSSPSFYGKAKESSKVSSYSIGKKAETGTSLSGKPGIYGKSQGGKPAGNSHMSKTLSSWKKSRAVKSSGPPPPPKQSSHFPNGVTEFPKPSSRSEEDEAYERRMRAYNPRLFRLQNRLGIEEPEETPNEEKKKSPKSRETTEEKQKRAAASRDKVKEFQKPSRLFKLQENMRKKQLQKKQSS